MKEELKRREELHKIAKEVGSEICLPMSALEAAKYMSLDKVSGKGRGMFELSTRRINDIRRELIGK